MWDGSIVRTDSVDELVADLLAGGHLVAIS